MHHNRHYWDQCRAGPNRCRARANQCVPEPKNQSKSTVERTYTPKVPYPTPPKRSKKEAEDSKCKEIIDQLTVRIPFYDACKMAPVLRRYVKKIVSNSMGLEEGVMMITEQCTAMMQNKMPKKMKDPGSFVLNCKIGNLTFERSLCDLGSGVNLMPYSVAKRLGMTDFTPTSIVLVLADRSVRIPEGVLEDLPVKIGECWIPADFIILDYDNKEPKDPLILGRPFLATAGACIDCKHGKIELKVNDKTMVFKMDEKLKRATIDGQTFMVEPLEVSVENDVKKLKAVDQGEKEQSLVQPELAKDSAAPSTAVKQKAPNIPLHSPPSKQRYAKYKPIPIPSSIVFAGKTSNPPNSGSHPGDLPHYLGRPHAPSAYTPPWMRRTSKKHALPLSTPPDI